MGLISKILSGEKTIESRWYVNKIAPWDKVTVGDTVYFKNSGDPVTAKAIVSEVIQFDQLDKEQFDEIVHRYGDEICLVDREYSEYYQKKNYVILISLSDAVSIEAFNIDKTGFGISSAWMCLGDIGNVKI